MSTELLKILDKYVTRLEFYDGLYKFVDSKYKYKNVPYIKFDRNDTEEHIIEKLYERLLINRPYRCIDLSCNDNITDKVSDYL